MNNLRFFVSRQSYGCEFTIRLGGWTKDGSVLATAAPVVISEIRREDLESGTNPLPAPMLTMTSGYGAEEALQSLMDELWREGFRPKDIGTAGHLAATQAHLGDMRAIVASKLEIQLPCQK